MPFCFIGILPRFPTRRFRLRAENAAPLTTPGLRSVAPVRSAFVAFFKTSSLRLPCARLLRPGERGVGIDCCASRLPCRVRRVASCHRASSCGDIHVAACSGIIPGWRHRAENCDDILSSLRSPKFTTEATHGRHPAEESDGHPARQRKRPPCGGLVKRRFTPVHRVVTEENYPRPH